MSGAGTEKVESQCLTKSNDGDSGNESSQSVALVAYDRATDSIVEAVVPVRKPSARDGVLSVFDLDTDSSGTDLTADKSSTRKQIACVHENSYGTTDRYARTHKRTRSDDTHHNANAKIIRMREEWRVKEAELVGEVINWESKYTELEKELNLENMHNAYLKATCRQYRKRAKEVRSVALAACDRDDALFLECNRNVELGLVFNGEIGPESDTGPNESSSSSEE